MLNILAVNDTVAGEIVVKYSLEVEPAKSFSNLFMKTVPSSTGTEATNFYNKHIKDQLLCDKYGKIQND